MNVSSGCSVCVLWLVITGVLIAWVHYGECKMGVLCWVQSTWVGYAGCNQQVCVILGVIGMCVLCWVLSTGVGSAGCNQHVCAILGVISMCVLCCV